MDFLELVCDFDSEVIGGLIFVEVMRIVEGRGFSFEGVTIITVSEGGTDVGWVGGDDVSVGLADVRAGCGVDDDDVVVELVCCCTGGGELGGELGIGVRDGGRDGVRDGKANVAGNEVEVEVMVKGAATVLVSIHNNGSEADTYG